MNINTQVQLKHMEVNTIPLVLCKQLFCVVSNETKVKGYWKNEEGQLFIDNIEVKEYGAINYSAFNNMKKLLFASGEEAVFYKDSNNHGIIEDREGSKEVLKNRIAWIETRKPKAKYIEALLTFHNGLTIYQLEEEVYLIEVYKA